MRIRFMASRAVEDPEKMVLPGIIFATKKDEHAQVWVVAAGWWDWSVKVLIARLTPTEPVMEN